MIGWFKSRQKQTPITGKSDCLSNRYYGSRYSNTLPKLGIPEVIRNYAGLYKHSNDIACNNSDGNRTNLFFIGRHLTKKEKRENNLRDHYERINDNVFKPWLNATAELRHQVDTFPASFMPLYVDIISKI